MRALRGPPSYLFLPLLAYFVLRGSIFGIALSGSGFVLMFFYERWLAKQPKDPQPPPRLH
jgi:hypothetical protein